MNPLVSIIVPVYNVEPYLRACLDSILAQTYQNWEAVLVDDGSKDQSGTICDEYARRDPRFIVVHKQNEGVAKARITAFEHSKGEFVTFVDADDYVDKQYIEKMTCTLLNSDASFVCCLENDVHKNEVLPKKRNIRPGFYDKTNVKQLLASNAFFDKDTKIAGMPLFLWGKLFRRDDVAEALHTSVGFWYGEDQQAIFHLLFKGRTFFLLDEYLYNYVHYDTQVTRRFRSDLWDEYYHNWYTLSELDKDGLLNGQMPYRMWKFSSKYLIKVRPHIKSIWQYRRIVSHIYSSKLIRRYIFDGEHRIFDVYGSRVTKIKYYVLRSRLYWLYTFYAYINSHSIY